MPNICLDKRNKKESDHNQKQGYTQETFRIRAAMRMRVLLSSLFGLTTEDMVWHVRQGYGVL